MLSSGLPERVEDHEDLARFLTSSSQFSSSVVKPSAFLPSSQSRETSVSRHGEEPRDSLWEIGRSAAGERNLHGAALFKAADVRAAWLDVLADEPPPRHAVIRGWPWNDDPDVAKAKQKELALQLASHAQLLTIG